MYVYILINNTMRIFLLILSFIALGLFINYIAPTDDATNEHNDSAIQNLTTSNNDDPCNCGGHCLCRPYPDCKRIVCW